MRFCCPMPTVKSRSWTPTGKIGISISETLEQSADKVVCAIKKGGCVTQDDLLLLFPVFSEQFLRGLLEKYTDGIIPTQINDFLCYQTIESLGLEKGAKPDSFQSWPAPPVL